MSIYSLSLFFFGFGVILIAVFALIRNPNRQSWIYFGFSISVIGWAFFSALWLSQLFSLEKSLLYARLAHAFAVFIPICWFHFVVEFLDQKPPTKYFYIVNYSLSFALSILNQTDLIISGMHSMPGIYFFTSPGKLYWVYVLLFYALVPYGFVFLIKSLLKTKGIRRVQIQYFMIATIIAFGAGSMMFLPVYEIPAPLILLTLMPLYPFLAGVSLIRYGLFDFYEMADIFRRDKLAAIGTLATSLNHEIRNPLYVIQGLSESHLDNVKQGMYTNAEQLINKSNLLFGKIAVQAARAMDIMKRFALFAKRGVDHHSIKEQVFLRDSLENVLPLIRYELELEKIELNLDIPENISPIPIDPRHFEEILFNLIVNSCQALKQKEGLGVVTIKTYEDDKKITISISDNGPGIQENLVKKIFDPFYTTKAEGTGLGLYITKQLLESNGGKIKIESKVGEGTTFTLIFQKATPQNSPAPPSVELPWLGVSVCSKGASLTSLFEKQKRGIVPKSSPLWVLGKEEFSESSPSLCVKHPNKEGNSFDSSPSLYAKHTNKEGLGELKLASNKAGQGELKELEKEIVAE